MVKWLDRLTGADKAQQAAMQAVAAAGEITRALEVFTEQKAAQTFDYATVFNSGQPLSLLGKRSQNVEGAYSKSWVAHACISRIATDVSGIPLFVLRDPGDQDSVVGDGHPLASLIARPSPHFSQSEMLQWLFTWLPLRGEFFIRFDNPMAPREMIFWDDPKDWREQLVDFRPARWVYRNGAQQYTGGLSDVLHHGLVNPDNPWRGLAPLQAAGYAYSIDTTADVLQDDVIQRGGERTVIWEFPPEITVEQREQAKSQLRGRRRNDGTVSNDVVIPVGAKLHDSKFMDSDLAILESQKMQPDKICAVYGLSKSLLGIEDIDKYATFQGRLKVYFTQTLIPMMTGVEAAFDSFFGRYFGAAWQGYVRFDRRAVDALFEDTVERFTAAGVAHAAGIPWTECNRRFRLGLEIESVPAADRVMVSSALAPLDKLVEEWDTPPVGGTPPPAETVPASPAKSAPAAAASPRKDGLTQAMVNKRAGDSRANVQRQMRLFRAEKAMRGEWRKMIRTATGKATEAISGPMGPDTVRQALSAALAGLPQHMVKVAEPYHEAAAREGAQAIVELVSGKMTDSELHVWKSTAPWRPDVEMFIRNRRNLITGMGQDLFADVIDAAVQAVMEGAESYELQQIVAQRLASGPGGANRAVTIARTEIGTAYSVSRDAEMRGQGFQKHMWLTAQDERVRDGEFDHAQCNEEVRVIGDPFSCGLVHPMAPGGEAGNVINCRCETVPLVAGMEGFDQ